MAAFVKSDLRQTIEYGSCFNQYIFDILSKLVDKSNEQVAALNNKLSINITSTVQYVKRTDRISVKRIIGKYRKYLKVITNK